MSNPLPTKEIKRKKSEVRNRNREYRARERREKAIELRCFWTWPIGHAYVNWQCVGCGKWKTEGT